MINDEPQVDDLDTTSNDGADDNTSDSDDVTVVPEDDADHAADDAEDAAALKAENAKLRAILARQKKKDEGVDAVVTNASEATLARLEARGIVDTEIQNYLVSAAKREGKHPVELLTDPYFKDRIDAMKRKAEQKAATPVPATRVPESKRDVEYWIKQVEAGKPNSPDPKMRKQVRAAIIAKS